MTTFHDITMGRAKVEIVALKDKKRLRATFKKRSGGAMKKLHELAILCNQDIFLYIRDQETGKVRTFASCDEKYIPDYKSISQEDCKGPKDMQIYYNRQQSQKSSDSPTHIAQQQLTQPLTMRQQPPYLDDVTKRKELSVVWNKIPNPRLSRILRRLISQNQICQRTLKSTSGIFSGISPCIR